MDDGTIVDPTNLKRFSIVTGHYGTGKTNLSLNLALDLAHAGEKVTLVDLDIVNPYFRTSDYAKLLGSAGVRVISPSFAGTTLETPSIPAEVYSAFDAPGRVIFDVGGDDAGATALGRFAREFDDIDYDMLYVINRYRNLTQSPLEAAALLREIESTSRLKATAVVNNSHLQEFTETDTILESIEFAEKTAELVGLPLMFTTVPVALVGRNALDSRPERVIPNAYPVEVYVRTPWSQAPGVFEEE